jgi:xanthine dehydrogenase accessory factor
MKHLVIVRGGGELASGAIYCLYKAGFRVLVLEQAEPTATRRKVSFSDAMYKGEAEVERVVCYLAKNEKEAKKRLKKGELVMLKDPSAKCIKELEPRVVVDALLRHGNVAGTNRKMAEHTIALGPGFCAGRDVDVVVETMRGHNLGRLIYEGYSYRDQQSDGGIIGDPANLEHLVFAPAAGKVKLLQGITLMVKKGDPLAEIQTKGGKVRVDATIDGVLRGAIHSGLTVAEGQKIADIHPSMSQEDCYTISDKARCIGGSVLEAVMAWEAKRPKRFFFDD